MPPVLGLDLGTTNTVAAWADDDGKIHRVEVDERSSSLPSVVCFHGGKDDVLIGESARRLMADDPKNTIFGAKRFLGRRYLSDYVGRNRGRVLFQLVEGADGLTAVDVRGETVSLEDVVLHLVNRIKELANESAGLQFDEAVVACPAHFHHRQRHALRRVVERAGLRVVSLVNEPTAAAVRSAAGHSDQATVLVYDLGGGTFDTTLMNVESGVVEVLGTGGDAFLGGNEFDARVVDYLVRRFHDDTGVDLRLNPIVLQKLAYVVENAKIQLSEFESAPVRVPAAHMSDTGFIDLDYTLTRQELDVACGPLIERTLGIAEQTVKNAGLELSEIDQLLLVGGPTRMPALRRRVREALSDRIDDSFDASGGVAEGAAVIGRGEDMLFDVLSIPICAMVPGGGPMVAFDRDARLPATTELALTPPPAGAPLPIIVYEAVDPTAIDRDVLGTIRLEPDWIAEHKGPLSLHGELTAAHALTFVIAAGDHQERVELVKPHAAAAKPAAPRPVSVDLPPADDAVNAALNIIVQVGDGHLERMSTTKISARGIYVCLDAPPALGTKVVIVLNREGTPWRLDGVVERALTAGAAQSPDEPAGFWARFVLEPDDEEALERFVGALRTVGDVDEVEAAAYNDPGMGEASIVQHDASSEMLRNFLVRLKENQLYEALRVPPTAPIEDIEAVGERLKEAIEPAQTDASERSAKKLRAAERLVDRVVKLLKDPRRRLEYDFREGFDCVEERLAATDKRGIFDPLLCKEVWDKVHPGRVQRAGRLRGRAARAIKESDLAAALANAIEAAQLDPFDLETRAFLDAIGKLQPGA